MNTFVNRFNARRINCLSHGLDKDSPSLFVGFPTMFDEFDLAERKTKTSTDVDVNDWVYSIHPLNTGSLLAVVGGRIDLYSKNSLNQWALQDTVLSENKRYQTQINGQKKWQRPFISAVTPLKTKENLFALGNFDGSVKIFDLENKKIIQQWQEHSSSKGPQKVWALETISENLFASGSEDRSIKFWDPREEHSVHTIKDHVGQVTSLLSLNENTLLAGTCPESLSLQTAGAEIRFYEIRK